ncbi:hypothetical protein [Nitrosomonas sp.]|uniref:hypothetical protein n=1 Tax=Nitrosomonas sp. TaxID=42353 RepID=UPI00374DAF73
MTTIHTKSVDCAVCFSATEITLLGSTNAFGSMDLDMRPPPMERDTLQYQIHRCPTCGFCGPRLAWFEGLDVSLVKDSNYLAILSDKAYPALANQFRAHAFLSSMANNQVAAIGAYLKAAWVCDDLGTLEAVAIACRQQVLNSMNVLRGSGGFYTDDLITDHVLRADLLRRSKQFDVAVQHISALTKKKLPEVLLQILNFQARLCASKDDACYQVSDAMSEVDS